MDATGADALPHGVASTRIPAWVLPNVPLETRRLLRPDLLIFQGLSSTAPLIPSHGTISLLPPAVLSTLQSGVTVHIVELTFTSHDLKSIREKEQQHLSLAYHLQAAGWHLSLADTSFRPPSPITVITRITPGPDGRLKLRGRRAPPPPPPNADINIAVAPLLPPPTTGNPGTGYCPTSPQTPP